MTNKFIYFAYLFFHGEQHMTEVENPIKRLIVSDAAVPFVAGGGHIFGRQIIGADPEIVDGDVVLVVDRKNRILTRAQFFGTVAASQC
jgi:archaeosine-15-forming tRNA-guanine transglycosylase